MGRYSPDKERNAEALAEAFFGIVLTQAVDFHKALYQAYPKLPKVSSEQWSISFVAGALFTALRALDRWGAPEEVKQRLGVIFVNVKNLLPEAALEYDRYEILFQRNSAKIPQSHSKPEDVRQGSEVLGDLFFQRAYLRQAAGKDEWAVKLAVGRLFYMVYADFWENDLQEYLNFEL